MPFIFVKTNFMIEEEREKDLKVGIAAVVRKNFGYIEKYILAGFEDNCTLYLRGDKSEKIVYIKVEVFGNKNHVGYKNFSRDITEIFSSALNVPARNIYTKFEDIIAFGVNGELYDNA